MPTGNLDRFPAVARRGDDHHVVRLGQRVGRVSKILNRTGVQTKHPGLTDDDIDQVAQLYEDGWSLARIGQRPCVTATTVHLQLRERGVTMRTPNGAAR